VREGMHVMLRGDRESAELDSLRSKTISCWKIQDQNRFLKKPERVSEDHEYASLG
ncbi:hypothetical protein J6590_002169, partial [Homalodisca vitripennis]